MEKDDIKTDNDPEWENRILCPDGKCIGIIGPDGKCGECGVMYGNLPEEKQKTAETESAPLYTGIQAPESDNDWENRRLCPDGNCIGVIGPAGRCGICGKED